MTVSDNGDKNYNPILKVCINVCLSQGHTMRRVFAARVSLTHGHVIGLQFDQTGMPEDIIKASCSTFTKPSPIQAQCWPIGTCMWPCLGVVAV